MVLGARIYSWIVISHCFFSLHHQRRWLQDRSSKRLSPRTTKVWEGYNERRAVTVSSVWLRARASQHQLKTVICWAAMPWHLGLPSWAVLMNWKRRADGSRNWQSSLFREKQHAHSKFKPVGYLDLTEMLLVLSPNQRHQPRIRWNLSMGQKVLIIFSYGSMF